MQPRIAAIAALVAGGLAVAIVGLDLSLNLEVRLETQRDGEWTTISRLSEDRYTAGSFDLGRQCASPHLRIVVDNDQPWSTSVEVRVLALNQSSAFTDWYENLYEDNWHLSRGEVRSQELQVPESVLGSREDAPASTSVQVLVNDMGMHTCVEAA